jgi:hypothetical protein
MCNQHLSTEHVHDRSQQSPCYLDCDLCAGGNASVERASLAQPGAVNLANAAAGDWLLAEAAGRQGTLWTACFPGCIKQTFTSVDDLCMTGTTTPQGHTQAAEAHPKHLSNRRLMVCPSADSTMAVVRR